MEIIQVVVPVNTSSNLDGGKLLITIWILCFFIWFFYCLFQHITYWTDEDPCKKKWRYYVFDNLSWMPLAFWTVICIFCIVAQFIYNLL